MLHLCSQVRRNPAGSGQDAFQFLFVKERSNNGAIKRIVLTNN